MEKLLDFQLEEDIQIEEDMLHSEENNLPQQPPVRGRLMVREKVMPETKLISRCHRKDDTCCLIYKRTYGTTLSPDRRHVK